MSVTDEKSTADLLAAFRAFASAFGGAGSPEELAALVDQVRELVAEMERLIESSQSQLAETVDEQLSKARDQLLSAVEQTADRVAAAAGGQVGGLTERVAGFEDDMDSMSSQVAEVVAASQRHETLLRDRMAELDVLLKTRLVGDWADQGELDALEGMVQDRLEQISAGFSLFQEQMQRTIADFKKTVDFRVQGAGRQAAPRPSKVYSNGTLVGERWGLNFAQGTVTDNGSDRVTVDFSGTYVAGYEWDGDSYEVGGIRLYVGPNAPANSEGSDGDVWVSSDPDGTLANLSALTDTAFGRSLLELASAAALRTLINVEDGATADQTAAEILTAVKTVDGTGSGLDADTLDGLDSTAFTPAASVSGKVARAQRTAGNVALNSNGAWTAIDTALDLTLTGLTAGQWVEVGIIGRWSTEGVAAGLDFFSMVSGSPVNAWIGTSRGGWGAPSAAQSISATGSVVKQLVSGDLSAGSLTLRLFGQTGSAAVKTLVATTTEALTVWARVLG